MTTAGAKNDRAREVCRNSAFCRDWVDIAPLYLGGCPNRGLVSSGSGIHVLVPRALRSGVHRHDKHALRICSHNRASPTGTRNRTAKSANAVASLDHRSGRPRFQRVDTESATYRPLARSLLDLRRVARVRPAPDELV